jgi:IS30 family transposase
MGSVAAGESLKASGGRSPEQTAGWLKRAHPEDEFCRVSHETIYRRLFVQSHQFEQLRRRVWRPMVLGMLHEKCSRCDEPISASTISINAVRAAIQLNRSRPA